MGGNVSVSCFRPARHKPSSEMPLLETASYGDTDPPSQYTVEHGRLAHGSCRSSAADVEEARRAASAICPSPVCLMPHLQSSPGGYFFDSFVSV